MIVAGIMSGTSADGINVALVKVGWTRATRPHASGFTNLSFKFLAQAEYPYPKQVRRAVLDAMNATQISVAYLARPNFLLAELYAEAVRRFGRLSTLVEWDDHIPDFAVLCTQADHARRICESIAHADARADTAPPLEADHRA